MAALFQLLIFPGFLFCVLYGLCFEYLDRKLYARMQNRIGPPWYQPLADFLKLIGKETLIPTDANRGMFQVLPLASFAVAVTAFIYVPVWGKAAVSSFEGDLIIVLLFITALTTIHFLAGWYSRDVYATIGSVRALTQMFIYEVPLFIVLLAPALIAGTWSITGITAFYAEHPLYTLINLPALFVALISGQGKLERAPFDAPEAETEVVGGAFVEYSGKLLAIFKLSSDCALVLVASLVSAIFLPFFTNIPALDFFLYLLKTVLILALLSVLRSVMARLRMDQMVRFGWQYMMSLSLVQIFINLIVRSALVG